MRNISLYSKQNHQFILLNESEADEEKGVRSNQYLITHDDVGILLDPGGWGVMPRVLTEMLRYIKPEQLKALILSHQDPDIVGGLGTWLELTQPDVYVADTWIRFLPHYGKIDVSHFIGVPDQGMDIEPVAGCPLQILPAHFLHSPGQINVYDPTAKILFSGDIGAAMLPAEINEAYVDDLEAHIPYINGFHRRYMASNRALNIWCDMVEKLDIDIIAPQHGPTYRGKAVKDLVAWLRQLQCGIDILDKEGKF